MGAPEQKEVEVDEEKMLGKKVGMGQGFEIVALKRQLVQVFFFQAEDGIRDGTVTGVQTCALPIWQRRAGLGGRAPDAGARAVASLRMAEGRAGRSILGEPLGDAAVTRAGAAAALRVRERAVLALRGRRALLLVVVGRGPRALPGRAAAIVEIGRASCRERV